MNGHDGGPPDDDELTALLVDFETQLAAGNPSTAVGEERAAASGDDRVRRLEDAKECLILLEEIWPHAKPLDDDLPLSIGRFQIVREVGRGGFGIVYLALDDRLGRDVALKVQRPETIISAALRQRFLREAQAAARLEHPYIAGVYEVGEAGLQVWIASEFVSGGSLAAWLRTHSTPVPPRDTARFMVFLAEALEYAHRHGVLHRDLKPSNVLVQAEAGIDSTGQPLSSLTPKVIDFGLARLDETPDPQTRTGILIGTPPYMAPEQATGKVRQISQATDVYGLGTILYELLTGQPAFQGENDVQALRHVIEDEPVRPRKLRAAVPVDLESICLKCLEKEPRDRYPTAAALAADIEHFLAGQPTDARPLSSIERLLKWSRRRPALASLWGVSAAAVLAIVLLTAVYVGRLREANETAEKARIEAQLIAEKSQQQEKVANQLSYAFQMRVAYQALDQGEIELVTETLDRYRPGSPLAALRGFEWYHLRRRLHNERLTLTGHKGEVYAVTFSPDGRQVVSGGEDGTIRFWDAESGSEMKSLAAHKNCVNAVVYSPNGAVLASASCDHTIKLWDAATLQPLGTLQGHENEVHCLAFCPTDSNRLAAGGHEPVVRIWDLGTRQIERTLDADGDVNGLAWRPDGTALASAGGYSGPSRSDQTYVWHFDNGPVELHPWRTFSVATSSRGDVFWGLLNATIHQGPSADAQPLLLPGHSGHVDAVACSPRGERFASAGADRTIRIWDSEKNICTQAFTGHTGRVQALAFSPRGSSLASASFDGTIKVWNDQPKDKTIWTGKSIVLGAPSASQVAISSGFRYLAVLTRPDEVSVHRLGNGTLVGTLPIGDFPRRLQFLAGRPVLCRVGSAPGEIEEWDVDAWKSINTYPMPTGGIDDLARWNEFLVVVRGAHVELVDASSGRICHDLARVDRTGKHLDHGPTEASQLVRSFDGNTLVVDRGKLRECGWILRATPGRGPREISRTVLPAASGDALVVSHDAALTVRLASNSSVALVDTATGRVLTTLRHLETVGPVAFSPDDKTLAIGAGERSVFLWNVASGQEITRLSVQSGQVEGVQFSSDGRRLAVISRADISEIKDQAVSYNYPGGHAIDNLRESTTIVTIWSGIDED